MRESDLNKLLDNELSTGDICRLQKFPQTRSKIIQAMKTAIALSSVEIKDAKKVRELQDSQSPYCSVCKGCGEDGCCPASICEQKEEGKYCGSYLADLRFGYIMFKETYDILEENHKEELSKIYDKNYDLIYHP